MGLTENPSAFRKWMVAGPEQARLLQEFEKEFIPEVVNQQKHHVVGFSSQKAFKEQAKNLIQSINEMGNPFLDGADELLMLDTRNVIDESVVKTVRTVEALSTKPTMNQSSRTVHALYMSPTRRIPYRSSDVQHPRPRTRQGRYQC